MSGQPVAGPHDSKTALLDIIKQYSAITTLAGGAQYISAALPNTSGSVARFWITATHAGGPRRFQTLPWMMPRLDLRVYGGTEFEAMRLYRTVRGQLAPPGGMPGIWKTAHGATVLGIDFETDDPFEDVQEGWPFCLAPVFVHMVQAAAS